MVCLCVSECVSVCVCVCVSECVGMCASAFVCVWGDSPTTTCTPYYRPETTSLSAPIAHTISWLGQLPAQPLKTWLCSMCGQLEVHSWKEASQLGPHLPTSRHATVHNMCIIVYNGFIPKLLHSPVSDWLQEQRGKILVLVALIRCARLPLPTFPLALL